MFNCIKLKKQVKKLQKLNAELEANNEFLLNENSKLKAILRKAKRELKEKNNNE